MGEELTKALEGLQTSINSIQSIRVSTESLNTHLEQKKGEAVRKANTYTVTKWATITALRGATEERLRQVEAQLQQSTTTSRMREQRAIETALFQSNGPWIVVSNLEQDMPPVEKETLAGQIAPTLQAQ